MRFPLRHAHENILIGHGEARAALYRLETCSFPFLSVDDKRAWLNRLANLAYGMEADFSLWRVNRSYAVHEYVTSGMAMLDARHQDAEEWRDHLRRHERHLNALGSFLPEIYLAVALKTEAPAKLGAGLMHATDRAWRTITELVRSARIEPIPGHELEALQRQEARKLRHIEGCLPARRATTRELQWLLRRVACRGIAEPKLDEHWKPPATVLQGTDGNYTYHPLRTSIERHANSPILEEDRALIVDGPMGRSYQAMLAMGALPEQCEFPGGAELLFGPLEFASFPVDVALHARWLPNREAIAKVTRRVVDADNQYREQVDSTHGPLSYETDENRHLARSLDAYLKSTDHPPLLQASIGLAVGAKDRSDLEQHVETLQHHYGAVTLHRPLGLQAPLFLDHLPRPDGGAMRDYEDILTVEQFGALMPIGTHHAGSERGAYIGRTVSGGARPIRFDVTEASRTGRPPSILLAGTLGSGKTIAAELLAYQAERRGSLIVDIDPKGQDHNLEGLPELHGRVHVIELSGDSQQGLLDPLVVAPEAMREDLANSYLMDLMPHAPPAWETQVRRAVKAVLATSERPCCMRVVNHLLAMDSIDARLAGDALAVWSDSGIARLGFDHGEDRSDLHLQRPVTAIKARGLALPGPGVARGDLDQQERLSVATLKLLAAYAMRLVSGDRSVHKLILFDEAWLLLSTADGRRLIDRLNRMGRSENCTLVLATQQLTDAGEIEALVGSRFIFGQQTQGEARQALALLGLDPDDRWLVDRVCRFRRGRCLFKDVEGRTAELQIDPASEDWLRILDTTPKSDHLGVGA